MKSSYYVIDTAALGEEMTEQQAEDYAKAMATRHPASTYLIVQSVGRTKHEIGVEWGDVERTGDEEFATHPGHVTGIKDETLTKDYVCPIDVFKSVSGIDLTLQHGSVAPSQGAYRDLVNGETIIHGDEFLKSDGVTWTPASCTVGKSFALVGHRPHRRPINSNNKPQ